MITKVVVVFDKKTALYENPSTVRHLGEAIRQWDFIRKDKENPHNRIAKNPEDFDLYHIADYDDETAKFIAIIPPTQLMSGVQNGEQ